METKEIITKVPVSYTFIGYYRIPKDTPIILDSIKVAHVIGSMMDCSCDFEIKKEDDEYIIIPDVSKIDLCHSMKFFITYYKQVRAKEIKIKANDCLPNQLFDISFGGE